MIFNLPLVSASADDEITPDLELNLMCKMLDSKGEVTYEFPLLISYKTIDFGLKNKNKEPLKATTSGVTFPANANIDGQLLKRPKDYILFTSINEIDKGYERFTEVTLYQLEYKRLTKKDKVVGRELVGIATSGRLFDVARITRNLRCSSPVF